MGTDDLDDVAGSNVFFGLEDVGEEFFFGEIGVEGDRGNFVGDGRRMMLAGLFEEGDQAFNFCGGVFVGFFRAGGIGKHGVDQNGECLRDAIEDEQLVGDEEIHDRRL